jgi:hypothetical protein
MPRLGHTDGAPGARSSPRSHDFESEVRAGRRLCAGALRVLPVGREPHASVTVTGRGSGNPQAAATAVTVAGDSELSSRLAVGLSFALRDHWQPYLTREAYCAFASLSEILVGFEPRRLA